MLFQENDNVSGNPNNYGNSTFTNILLATNSNGIVPVQFVATHQNGVNLCVFNRLQVTASNASVYAMLLKNCTWMVFNGLDIEFDTAATNFKPLQINSGIDIQINGINSGSTYGIVDLVGSSQRVVIVDPENITLTNSDSSALSDILILVARSIVSPPRTTQASGG